MGIIGKPGIRTYILSMIIALTILSRNSIVLWISFTLKIMSVYMALIRTWQAYGFLKWSTVDSKFGIWVAQSSFYLWILDWIWIKLCSVNGAYVGARRSHISEQLAHCLKSNLRLNLILITTVDRLIAATPTSGFHLSNQTVAMHELGTNMAWTSSGNSLLPCAATWIRYKTMSFYTF